MSTKGNQFLHLACQGEARFLVPPVRYATAYHASLLRGQWHQRLPWLPCGVIHAATPVARRSVGLLPAGVTLYHVPNKLSTLHMWQLTLYQQAMPILSEVSAQVTTL